MLICEELDFSRYLEEDDGTKEINADSDNACQCQVCLELGSSNLSTELMDQIFSPALDGGGFHVHPRFRCPGKDIDAACLDHCAESESDIDSIQLTMDFESKLSHKENTENTLPKQRSTCQNAASVKDASTDSHCTHSCNHSKHSDKIKRISCSDRNDSSDQSKSDILSDSKVQQCDCCYCEVFGHGVPPSAPISRNFVEMRERLRFILSKKRTNCKGTPNMPLEEHNLNDKKGPLKPGQVGGDTRNLDELLDFIEGNEARCRNEKKAAKKARQKEKKVQLMKKKDEEEKSHGTCKEELAQSQLQSNSQNKKKTDNSQSLNNTTKIQNKNNASSDSAPQMVTIKRIMNSNNAEPTVTITLRGATPNQDRVLYTLFNGQVCEVKESKKNQPTKGTSPKNTSKPPQNNNEEKPSKPIAPPAVTSSSSSKSSKKDKKQKKEAQKPIETVKSPEVNFVNNENCNKQNSNAKNQRVSNSPSSQSNNMVNRVSKSDPKYFKIEDLKLPPGITITKVDPCAVRSKVPMKDNNSKQVNSNNTSNQNTMSSEVIVVATGNLKDQNMLQSANCPIDNQTSTVNNVKKKKNKKKNDAIDINSLNSHVNGYDAASDFSSKENNYRQNSVTISFDSNLCSKYRGKKPVLAPNMPSEELKKKKKKGKNVSPKDKDSEEWRSLDNVFAPKDIDLDNGDIDDAERELEAFKRFCSQSVPPKCKEKVHFNVKDIIVKKSSTSVNEDYDS